MRLPLNISSKGLLALMDCEPAIDQVMRVSVPSPCHGVSTPTLVDVRWTRKVPLLPDNVKAVYFVGMRFVLS